MNDFLLEGGETFVFAGDSITDCGRRAEYAPFGNGYIKAAIELVAARYPDRKIAWFNEDISCATGPPTRCAQSRCTRT